MNTKKRKPKIPKSQRIKVWHIVHGLTLGGAERMVVSLLKYADKTRFDVRVICVSEGGPFEADVRALGIPVTVIGKSSKLGLKTVYRLYKLMRKESPDICHTHLFTGDTWGRIAAFLARVPLVISTEHNTNVQERGLKAWVRNILSKKTDVIVPISDAIKEYSIKEDGIAEKKMQRIYSGLDFAQIDEAIKEIPSISRDHKVISVIGRLVEQKGHTYVLQALPELIQEYPNMRVQFIGDGPLRETLKQQTRDLGVEKHVEFLGWKKDVYTYMKQADVICMPSIYEGLGLVAQEALYVQTPIIASRVGGLQEIISHQETGLLVEPKNVFALAEALSYALSHEQEMQTMAQKGHAFVKEHFDAVQLTREYEALYTRLLREQYMKEHKIEDAVVALTYLCNSRCVMCNIWKITDKPTMALEHYKKLPSTIKDLNISGGEPFMRPEIVEIVKTIKESNPRVRIIISSNGFSTDLIVKRVKQLLEIDPHIGVALSLDGVEEKHVEVRGIPDGYNKVINTLHALKDLGVKHLRLAFTAGDYNIDHMLKVYELARKERVDFTLAAVHNSENYFAIEDNVIDAKKEFVDAFLTYIKKELARFNPKSWLRAYFGFGLLSHVLYGGRILPDYSGKKHIFVDPDGRVYPCDIATNVMGNIMDFDSYESLVKTQDAYEAVAFNRSKNKHWMICTSRMAIKAHPFRVLYWIIKSKLFGVRV